MVLSVPLSFGGSAVEHVLMGLVIIVSFNNNGKYQTPQDHPFNFAGVGSTCCLNIEESKVVLGGYAEFGVEVWAKLLC